MTFKRELGSPLRNCLGKGEGWWQDVMQHKQLAIAIRNRYLNVYSKGQSIFKVKEQAGSLRAETHYKYLVDQAKTAYRLFTGGVFNTDGLHFIKEYNGKKTLDHLIRNAEVYAGNEKRHVHSILRNNSNVIDLEVAFTTSLERNAEDEEEKNRTDRIDLVALEEGTNGSIAVVFYEVKTFHDTRIRAKQNAEILGTLEDYKASIKQAERDIELAYRQVCRDLMFLKRPVGWFDGEPDPLIIKAADDNVALHVDPSPRLVIVDYSEFDWNDQAWQDQLKNLRRHFRVIPGQEGRGIRLPRS